MRNRDNPAWVEEYLAASNPRARAAYEDTLSVAGDEDAAWNALHDVERALRVAEVGHDCEMHMEWVAIEAPCPACPDGMWRAHDAICAVCKGILQAAGHVHGPWLARTDNLLLGGL
jgi:hypothetical protein